MPFNEIINQLKKTKGCSAVFTLFTIINFLGFHIEYNTCSYDVSRLVTIAGPLFLQ